MLRLIVSPILWYVLLLLLESSRGQYVEVDCFAYSRSYTVLTTSCIHGCLEYMHTSSELLRPS